MHTHSVSIAVGRTASRASPKWRSRADSQMWTRGRSGMPGARWGSAKGRTALSLGGITLGTSTGWELAAGKQTCREGPGGLGAQILRGTQWWDEVWWTRVWRSAN